jgi:4-hydroxybenzoate polyprenyltransferase/3-deoxy-D-manno-octulosonate 8-phosphate phosphatase KdsC-like HAD superfamily phosphatase
VIRGPSVGVPSSKRLWPESPGKPQEILCVDLDGTLIAGDLFLESTLRMVMERPWLVCALPIWLLMGKAHLKRQVASRVPVMAEHLPYRIEVLDQLRIARENGGQIILATGSDTLHAEQVGAYLGIFSKVLGSDGHVNLTGRRKAERLREEFGHGQFHYFGNDWADIPVWQAAGSATVVAGPKRLVKHVRDTMNLRAELQTAPNHTGAMLRALRLHQWAKNLLVFVPLVTSHRLVDVYLVGQALVAFLSFGLCASAIYIINDLFDIPSDRAHPRKRFRPFASGELSVPVGLIMAGVLLAFGVGTAGVAVSRSFLGVLLLYITVTTAYSARLKREPVLDVFVLASLYVLRVIGGGVATDITISNWLLGFGLFLFLSLAFVKRYTELVGQQGRMPGRGYSAEDHPWMLSIGTSAGYMAVVILALYVNSAEVVPLYTQPRILWLLCLVMLFWITRMWFRAGRQQVHDDPVLEALKDPASYGCALAAAAILFAAL